MTVSKAAILEEYVGPDPGDHPWRQEEPWLPGAGPRVSRGRVTDHVVERVERGAGGQASLLGTEMLILHGAGQGTLLSCVLEKGCYRLRILNLGPMRHWGLLVSLEVPRMSLSVWTVLSIPARWHVFGEKVHSLLSIM